MTSDPLELAARVLAAQPFSALLGTRLGSFGPGRASLVLDAGDSVRQQYGFVHGGVLAYLVDNAITFAAASVLGDGVVTVEMKVNYLRPARGGGRLVAEASVLDASRNQAVCRCDVNLEDGAGRTLVAAGQGTIRRTSAAGAVSAPLAA